jgi:hypothetical protein
MISRGKQKPLYGGPIMFVFMRLFEHTISPRRHVDHISTVARFQAEAANAVVSFLS